jgi:hypothetical protein
MASSRMPPSSWTTELAAMAPRGRTSDSAFRSRGRLAHSAVGGRGLSVPFMPMADIAAGGQRSSTLVEICLPVGIATACPTPANLNRLGTETSARRKRFGCDSAAVRAYSTRFPRSPLGCIGRGIIAFVPGRPRQRTEQPLCWLNGWISAIPTGCDDKRDGRCPLFE